MPEAINGYHIIVWGPLPMPIMPENSRMGTVRADKKDTTNQGMTWTKSRVFKAARLLLLDVNPIHIPTQINAARFASTVTVPAAAIVNVTERLSPFQAAGAPFTVTEGPGE